MGGERERDEIDSKNICLDRLLSPDVCGKVWEVFCLNPEVEGVGNSLDVSSCVLVVPPFVFVRLFLNMTEKPMFGQGMVPEIERKNDIANVIRPEVTGLRGFWDGSCQRGVYGASMLWFSRRLRDGSQKVRTWARPKFPRCCNWWLCHVDE